jgi:cellobiose phosphorylase
VVWPQIQGFWAQAAAMHGKSKLLWHEFSKLAEHAVRDMQFSEIYHPFTGERYGGMQEGYRENQGKIMLWRSTNRQTWAATAYIRMVIFGLLGAEIDESGIRFSPCIPAELDGLTLSNLRYRDMIIRIKVSGQGSIIREVRINGKPAGSPFLLNRSSGPQSIEINLL